MALTPEEVINKRFQPTKFKEGYNLEEVDDFLDEIVIELRRLNAENASLKRQLEEAEAKISLAPAQQQGGALAEAEIVVDSQPAAVAPAPAAAPAAADPTLSPSSATGLLAMAQKVHDDYVFEGKRERERLITEGREEAAQLVSEAQKQSNRVLGDLEKTKSNLEVSVAKLRSFENQYRTSLRDYLNKQLTTLEETPALEPKAEGAPAAAASQSQGFGAFGQRNGVFSNNS
ncbi:DivIVA domain-containing protein [Rothia nasimurium]|uniref:Cell wall synthesis protein Wag31 n=1 Tax=Rothia nasimurium TaxID=85336 RepID=A0A4Y9F7A6_9MICC|nr:DivIVA domain-containing protein [Rothia nasimurium]MBF0807438.1 DivIVA domain-containing protein [Rothia nasimurium]TFU23737.1 DivIVA domain-containing protein [Rothia nasimurium]